MRLLLSPNWRISLVSVLVAALTFTSATTARAATFMEVQDTNGVTISQVVIAPGESETIAVCPTASSFTDGRGVLFDNNANASITVSEIADTSYASGGCASFTLNVDALAATDHTGTINVTFRSPSAYADVNLTVIISPRHTITFYDRTTELSSDAYAYEYYTVGDFDPADPTRTGYTFGGWEDSEGLDYLLANSIPASDLSLYAIWSGNEYTVSFDSSGGDNSPAAHVYNYSDGSFTLPSPGSKPGYTFNGWYDEGTYIGGTGDSVTEPAYNTTYYADWSADSLTVSYDENGGDTVTDYDYTYSGGTFTLPTPARNGYTFNAWYYGESEFIGLGGATVTEPTSSLTYYADWTANDYTVTYNSNGGSNSPVDYTFTYSGSTFTLPDPGTKAGYTFDGWYEEGFYVGGSGATVDEPYWNAGLYAEWTPDNLTLSFDENGGDTVNDIEYTYSGGNLTLPTATRNGYTFDGWYVGEGDFVGNGGDSVAEPTGNTTYYAGWIANDYTVYFDENGGNNAPADHLFTFSGGTHVLPSPGSIPGYSFNGWYDEGTYIGMDGDSVDEPYFNQYLTADWVGLELWAYFDENGGDGVTDIDFTYDGGTITLPYTSRNGYIFDGWSDGEGIVGVGGDTINQWTSDMYLTAVWTPGTYTVSFDSNGGDNDPRNHSYTYSETTFTLPSPGERPGYRFIGWFDEGTEIGTWGDDVDEPYYNVTYYAEWEEILTVTYDANGGTSAIPSADLIGDNLILPVALRDGYVFLGWFDESDNEIGGAGIAFVPENDITLYAQWAEILTVTYNGNGGVAGIPSAEYSVSDLALPSATRTNYRLDGWYTAPVGGTRIGTTGQFYAPNADVTLYAHWIPTVAKSLTRYGFAVDSSTLTTSMKTSIRNFINANPDYTRIVCTGYTDGPITRGDAALAKARAVKACAYAKTINPALVVSIQYRTLSTPGAIYRKFVMTLPAPTVG